MSTCQHLDPVIESPDDRGEQHVLWCCACGQQLVRDSDRTLYEIAPRKRLPNNEPYTCLDPSPAEAHEERMHETRDMRFTRDHGLRW